MGIPKVYGAEIPARGLTLLEGLYPIVEESLKADDGYISFVHGNAYDHSAV